MFSFKNIFLLLLLPVLINSACQDKGKSVAKVKSNFVEIEEKVLQGLSLFGDSLVSSIDSVNQKRQLDQLKQAELAYLEDPNLENLIWLGRREAYLGRYDLAIRTFSKAIDLFPESYEPYRHRGHRYISIRQFDRAIADFQKAVELMEGKPLEIEEDGMPNKLNIPLSTGQFNVWYHLGLGHYLKGDWEDALEAYKKCLEVSDNDDLIVATLDWYYMTLVKLGRDEEATELLSLVHNDMEIIENDAYFKRLLMYKGELESSELMRVSPDTNDQRLQYVTQGYGLGNYFLANGDTLTAKSIFDNVISTGYWSAFGYIASEMELANLSGNE